MRRLGGWAARRLVHRGRPWPALHMAGLAVVLAAQPPSRLAAQSSAAQPPSRLAAESDSLGRLWRPDVVQQRAVTTDRDNDSLVQAIEGRLRCTCGCNLDVYTCRTTDFSCATSPAMHRAVLARLDSALAAGYAEAQASDTVVAGFESQYGQVVLMAPPRRGFNWAAYVVPFVGLAAGLGILLGLMRRWVRVRDAAAPAAATPAASEAPPGASAAEVERLRAELEHFEA